MKRKIIFPESAMLSVLFALAIVWIALQFCLTGCSHRIYVPVEHKVTESVFVRDTVVDVQVEYHRDSVVTTDSVSVLTNPYAISRAALADGKLLHSLTTRSDAVIPVKVQYVERYRTDSVQVPFEVEKKVYVTKQPTLFQIIKYHVGGLSIALVGLVLAIFAYRKIKR
jgi:hypothetical protein